MGRSGKLILRKADVAQLVEQPIRNRQVIGSIPILGSILFKSCRIVHRDLLHICCTSYFASSCFMASVTTLGTVLI